MKILAIIPARSGSKGVKNKNIKPICGKPLLSWAVDAAVKSDYIQRVIVSTDSDEYATIAQKAGAETPFLRPNDISSDTASSESALLHCLDWLEVHEHYTPDLIVFLQCTSPLMTSSDIDKCIKNLIEHEADSCFSATLTHDFLWKEDKTAAIGINHNPQKRLMRQQKEPEYKETGAVYVMRTNGFKESKHRFFGKTLLTEIDLERSWQIDDLTDWKICETLLKNRLEKDILERLPNPVQAIVFDFDGVLTDNKVWVNEKGEESVSCSRSDGLGFGIIKSAYPSIKLLILSKERNPVVTKRAQKLGIEVTQGVDNKIDILDRWLDQNGISREATLYLGNDLNDIQCIEAVGCGIAVGDAYPEVKQCADIILKKSGGNGAVRELLDLVIKSLE